MPYKYLEDIAVADIAFEAWGKTLNELFESSAHAVTNAMVKDLKSIEQNTTRHIKVKAENVETLLHDFMQEIIYYKDAEKLLFNSFKTVVKGKSGKWEADCVASGEALDMKKHELIVDVKAVTWHHYSVGESPEGWKASVILDI